ncbi:MAG: hypothetical protein Q9207_008173 [Kuettlingeria erythrocarpa]
MNSKTEIETSPQQHLAHIHDQLGESDLEGAVRAPRRNHADDAVVVGVAARAGRGLEVPAVVQLARGVDLAGGDEPGEEALAGAQADGGGAGVEGVAGYAEEV